MNTHKEGVVLLHGIFRTHRSMAGFARFLKRHGFAVLNLGYPSTKQSIDVLTDTIHPSISAFAAQVTALHFVGYSMGGLLIRAYIHKHRPHNLGRVVMIGTPNHGSEVADFLKDWRPYKVLYGAAGQQLITTQDEFAHLFGQVDYELGIIAGNRPIDPISSRIIGKPNDGKVSIDSTTLEGMKEHIVVACSHTFFPTHKLTWQHSLSFLRHGRFLTR